MKTHLFWLCDRSSFKEEWLWRQQSNKNGKKETNDLTKQDDQLVVSGMVVLVDMYVDCRGCGWIVELSCNVREWEDMSHYTLKKKRIENDQTKWFSSSYKKYYTSPYLTTWLIFSL